MVPSARKGAQLPTQAILTNLKLEPITVAKKQQKTVRSKLDLYIITTVQQFQSLKIILNFMKFIMCTNLLVHNYF